MKMNFLYNQKIAPYIFILPFILTFFIFFLYPLLSSFVMSFYQILPGANTFIGLDNYLKMVNPTFGKAIVHSLLYTVLTLIFLIPFPMAFAVLISSKAMRLRVIFESVLFLPALTSVVVAGMIFKLMFGSLPTAQINLILSFFGFDPVKWTNTMGGTYFILLIMACWKWTGVNMLYFLSGLQNIPQELYEAADMDGLNGFQKFFYITLPLLSPITKYVLTISIYAGLAMFTESFILFGGAKSPNDIGLTIVGYLYRSGISQNNFGFASAVGMFLLAFALLINLVQLFYKNIFRKGARV